jgi:hypothetical protein
MPPEGGMIFPAVLKGARDPDSFAFGTTTRGDELTDQDRKRRSGRLIVDPNDHSDRS